MKFLELDLVYISICNIDDYLSFYIRKDIVSCIPVPGYSDEVKNWGFLHFFTHVLVFTYMIFRFDYYSYIDSEIAINITIIYNNLSQILGIGP